MARLYGNENFPFPVIELLREAGHDVITVAETGKANIAWADEEVLKFAAQDDRAVLTFNRKHFIRLHHQQQEHAGIVACTMDSDFAALSRRIDQAIRTLPSLQCQLVRVNRPDQ